MRLSAHFNMLNTVLQFLTSIKPRVKEDVEQRAVSNFSITFRLIKDSNQTRAIRGATKKKMYPGGSKELLTWRSVGHARVLHVTILT